MTGALAAENRALVDDNKQLGALIKEYEQTLEGIMATFRNRAVRGSFCPPLIRVLALLSYSGVLSTESISSESVPVSASSHSRLIPSLPLATQIHPPSRHLHPVFSHCEEVQHG